MRRESTKRSSARTVGLSDESTVLVVRSKALKPTVRNVVSRLIPSTLREMIREDRSRNEKNQLTVDGALGERHIPVKIT